MQVRLAQMLVCPACSGELRLETSEVGTEVSEGQLVCQSCPQVYPVSRGVPRLLLEQPASSKAQRTADRFGAQWKDFDFISPYYKRQFLGWIAPNTPQDFKGKQVLEGGCGKGRHSALVAEFGAREVFAVDLGPAVDVAYRNTRHLENVHVIQADLFHLPIRPRSVDVAFSVGVLHHTPDPKGCLRNLAETVRAGGKLIAWVYGRENNGWIVFGINPLRRAVTSRLPHRWVYHLSKLPAGVLYGLIRGVYAHASDSTSSSRKLFYQSYLAHLSKFPFREVHSIVHDHLTPPIAHYIREHDFRQWFEELGLEDIVIQWHNENSWRGTARKTQSPELVQAPALK